MATVTKNRTGNIIFLWPEQLKVDKGFNIRFDMGDLTSLGKSILANGIKEPLRGWKTKEKTEDGYPIYCITDGHRRFEAAKRIADKMEEGDFIPMIVEPEDYTTEQRTIDSLVTGENSKTLNLLESAKGVKRLVDGGMSKSDVAKSIGKSPTHITDCMILMEKATEQMLADIKSGVLTASSVVEMLKVNDAEVVEKTIDKAKNKAAAAGKTKVKASELEEAHGEPVTTKGKKAASSRDTSVKAAGKEKEEKVDVSLQRLLDLKAALKAQADEKIKPAFDLLNALIKIAKGTAMPIDVVPLFFVQEEEGEEEIVVEEEEVAPPKKKSAKPTGGMKTLKEKKKAAKKSDDEDEEDLELQDLPDDDDEELE